MAFFLWLGENPCFSGKLRFQNTPFQSRRRLHNSEVTDEGKQRKTTLVYRSANAFCPVEGAEPFSWGRASLAFICTLISIFPPPRKPESDFSFEGLTTSARSPHSFMSGGESQTPGHGAPVRVGVYLRLRSLLKPAPSQKAGVQSPSCREQTWAQGAGPAEERGGDLLKLDPCRSPSANT